MDFKYDKTKAKTMNNTTLWIKVMFGLIIIMSILAVVVWVYKIDMPILTVIWIVGLFIVIVGFMSITNNRNYKKITIYPDKKKIIIYKEESSGDADIDVENTIEIEELENVDIIENQIVLKGKLTFTRNVKNALFFSGKVSSKQINKTEIPRVFEKEEKIISILKDMI